MSNKFLSGINITGLTTLNTVENAGVDTDKFLVLDSSGNVDFRTGAELLSDIGAPSGSFVPYTDATGNVDLGEYNIKSGAFKFDLTPSGTVAEGTMQWNSSDGTVDIGLKGGNVVLQVGQETVYEVRNETGTQIPNGTAVYANGVTAGSGRITAAPYVADGSVRENRFLGVATENISNGVNGFVTHFGYVRGLDTRGTSSSSISVGDETWAVGDVLYVHPTVAGKLTNVKPQHEITVAIIITRHQSSGILFVRPSSGGHLEDIHDVAISSVANNDGLFYESSTSLWKNKSIATILGYTPVPNSRTLTINDVTYDLSADRSWTIEAGGSSASTRTIQKFTSTSSQTTFTITGGYTVGMVDVWVNGVKLDNATEFTASNGTTVVLTTGLTANQIVEVYKYGSQFIANNALRQKTLFTATSGQTVFTVNYSVGLVDVFYNGSKLDDTEFTATNGTSITLGTACSVNDKLEVFAYSYNVNGFTGIGGSGTTNYLAKFSASGVVANSVIYDNGTNVGIGTSSPLHKLTIAAASSAVDARGGAYIYSTDSMGANLGGQLFFGGSYTGTSETFWASIAGRKENGTDNNVAGYLAFATRPAGGSNTERMRITSGGYLKASNNGTYINGVTSTFHSLEQSGTTDVALYAYNSYVGNGNVILARGYSNNTSGSLFLGYSSSLGDYTIRIFSNGNIQNTNNSYGSLSDIKLKENIIDSSSKLEDLLKVRIVNYNLIGHETKQIGVIAQELEQIFPSMIEEVADTDEMGNDLGTTTKSVKYSVFIPMLIKAIQEQQAQIDELKQLINK